MATEIKWNDEGFDDLIKQTVNEVCVPLAQKVADASNEADGLKGSDEKGHDKHDGYQVGTEGGKPLEKHDYRATVITATNQAMARNAENNTLVRNLHTAAGGE